MTTTANTIDNNNSKPINYSLDPIIKDFQSEFPFLKTYDTSNEILAFYNVFHTFTTILKDFSTPMNIHYSFSRFLLGIHSHDSSPSKSNKYKQLYILLNSIKAHESKSSEFALIIKLLTSHDRQPQKLIRLYF